MKLIVKIEPNALYTEYINQNSVLDCYEIERDKFSQSVINKILDNSHGNCVLYFLVNKDESKLNKRRLYVGETSNLYNRMLDHRTKKDWWTHMILFTGDKRKVDEANVLSLEKLFIDNIKSTNLYEFENKKNNNKEIDADDSLELKYNNILSIMSFLNYPLELQSGDNVGGKRADINYSDFTLLDELLMSNINNIKFDQQKLYRTYYTYLNNEKILLFALWPNGEAELYIKLDKINLIAPSAYDITNRLRGKRESAIKLKTKEDYNSLIKIIDTILKHNTSKDDLK